MIDAEDTALVSYKEDNFLWQFWSYNKDNNLY